MVGGIWQFLKEPANLAVLGSIGAGITAIAGGAWAFFTYFHEKKEEKPPSPPPDTTIIVEQKGTGIDDSGKKIRLRITRL